MNDTLAGTSPSSSSSKSLVEDIETVLEKYSYFLSQLQFEKAREYVEERRVYALRHVTPWDKKWITVMTALSQVAVNECAYFSLSFFTAKFSFRKESHLKDIYNHIRTELSQIVETSPPPERCTTSKNTTYLIACSFINFVKARIELIEFYTALSSLDWKSAEEEGCAQKIEEMLTRNSADLQDNSVFGVSVLIERELNILKQAFTIHQHITNFKMLETLLLLKAMRENLSTWFKQVDDAFSPSRPSPSFFKAFTKSKHRSKLALLHWFELIYHSLLGKFSLYYHDVLAPFSFPNGEMKSVLSPASSGCILHSIQMFSRKCNPKLICVIANRIEDDSPFYGYGYHKVLNDLSIGEGFKPMTGINEKYPSLFYSPADKRSFESLHPDVTSIVQDAYLKHGDDKVQYLHDKVKDQCFFAVHVENNIYLVVVLDRKVQEKDASVIQFFNDFLMSIRGVKVFQDLRGMPKT
jgi:hypothetical protein